MKGTLRTEAGEMGVRAPAEGDGFAQPDVNRPRDFVHRHGSVNATRRALIPASGVV